MTPDPHTPDDDRPEEHERRTPTAHEIEPAEPEEFGCVQVWWGDGKGKTTAALGMGFRAAGHGYRVHLLQFMKGGAGSVEDVRGEYNAIERLLTFTYEATGEFGWHGFADGSSDDDHDARARAGLERARELSREPKHHMLILDEVLYAANRGLIEPADVVDLVESKDPDIELVLTGGHSKPEYLYERADLITNVRKERHMIEAGQGARKGTEY
jgi:cob(I)alamin adenosyltransferase